MNETKSDRFYYGWVIVAVATLALVVSNGLSIGGIPVFYKAIREDLVASGAVAAENAESFIAFGASLTFLLSGLISPIAVSCMDHSGAHKARVQQWDGSKWNFITDWIEADYKYLRPKVDKAAKEYGTQKNITARDCSKES